jgi:hypothetical protein
VQEFESTGKTKQDAIDNAKMIEYTVELTDDSIFIFHPNIRSKIEEGFIIQGLNLTLYIPYGQRFVIHRNLENILGNMNRYGYYQSQLGPENTWEFTPNSLECITCNSY